MTVNPPSVVDAAAFTVRRTIDIAAAPEKVWAAVTEPEHLARWFPQRAELASLAVGSPAVFTWDDENGVTAVPLRIEELDPPRSIAYRWRVDEDAYTTTDPALVDFSRSTVFRFTLEPTASGTRLTVVETGFDAATDPAAALDDHRGGWDSELDELVVYAESDA